MGSGDRLPGRARGALVTARERRAVIFLFVLSVLLGVFNLFWTAHEVSANNGDRCATIVQLASIPIPRPVAGNPSRVFAAHLEAIYRDRARQIGCMP